MKKNVVSTPQAPAAIGPYSQAIDAGFAVFISGQIPLDPTTGKMPETLQEQAHRSLQNVQAILNAAGLTMDNVVKTTCFLSDLKDFSAFNDIYAQYFTNEPPARSAVEVSALPKGAKLEVEVIAVR